MCFGDKSFMFSLTNDDRGLFLDVYGVCVCFAEPYKGSVCVVGLEHIK